MTGSAGAVDEPARPGWRLRLVAGVGLAAMILASLVLSRLGWADATNLAASMVRRAQQAGPVGWLFMTLIQAGVAMLGIFPASLLGMAAGAVYGVWLGFALAAAGTLLGGSAAFLLARSLLRPWVEKFLRARAGTRLAGLDRAVARDGWRFVCLVRISPVMPFALASYAFGLTCIRKRDYLIGTLAALPALLGYVTMGSLARRGVLGPPDGAAPAAMNWVLMAVGIAASAVLVLRSRTLLARCGFLPQPPSG